MTIFQFIRQGDFWIVRKIQEAGWSSQEFWFTGDDWKIGEDQARRFLSLNQARLQVFRLDKVQDENVYEYIT